MSSESEVTEFEQERMQHPTGHCEDCGCPLEVCCKPKKPVRLASESVDLKWLKDWCKNNKHPVEWDGSDGKHYETETVQINDLVKWAEKEAKKK